MGLAEGAGVRTAESWHSACDLHTVRVAESGEFESAKAHLDVGLHIGVLADATIAVFADNTAIIRLRVIKFALR